VQTDRVFKGWTTTQQVRLAEAVDADFDLRPGVTMDKLSRKLRKTPAEIMKRLTSVAGHSILWHKVTHPGGEPVFLVNSMLSDQQCQALNSLSDKWTYNQVLIASAKGPSHGRSCDIIKGRVPSSEVPYDEYVRALGSPEAVQEFYDRAFHTLKALHLKHLPEKQQRALHAAYPKPPHVPLRVFINRYEDGEYHGAYPHIDTESVVGSVIVQLTDPQPQDRDFGLRVYASEPAEEDEHRHSMMLRSGIGVAIFPRTWHGVPSHIRSSFRVTMNIFW